MIQLHRPDARFHRSYLEASDEFGGAHRDGDGTWVEEPDDGGHAGIRWDRAGLESPEVFSQFVSWRMGRARVDAPRPTGHVPATSWWVYDDVEPDTYLGSLEIRHSLTSFLREVGGHIGYSIRPTARRRGVATAALRLALPHAAALGIDPVLLTCDVDNVGSAKVIEANGGVLEDIRGTQRRYWVPART